MRTMNPTLRITGLVALAAVGMAALPATAIAGEKQKINPVARSEKPGAVVDEAKRQYCANMRRGSSAYNHQVCRTRAEWAEQGVEIAAAGAGGQVASGTQQ